jgi:hypothetical protein
MARSRRRPSVPVALTVLAAVVAVVGATVLVLRRDRQEARPPRAIAVAPWRQDSRPVDPAAIVLTVAPDGGGSVCSADRPCSLVGARDRIRAVRADTASPFAGEVRVRVRGGTYAMAAPLELGPQDSGVAGHRVIYEAESAASPPVLSGGTVVSGWTETVPGSGLFRAPVPPELDTRQLFVNDRRATRARGAQDPAGWSRTTSGFQAPDGSMAAWSNKSAIEVVSFKEWKSLRCPIAEVVGRDVTMAQPCWKNANAKDPNTMTAVTWIENAFELLDEPGEWYLDKTSHELFYEPRPGEDLSSARVVAATTETLVSIAGAVDQPVHDVELRGLTFRDAGWIAPNSPEGYPVVQAGWHTYGDAVPTDERKLHRVPGAVSALYAHDLRIEDSTFVHLGGSALDLRVGSQGIGVVGNRFSDVSGHGVQVGETDYFVDRPSLEADRLDRFDISNNVIEDVAAEYLDTVGVLVTYASNVSILHNEIAHLPYTGISVGWGWGTDSYARHNVIAFNRVRDVMRTLNDGGAIYTLSSQPDSLIYANHIDGVVHMNGALYLDEGTRDYTVARNVVERSPRWLHLWTDTIRDDVVVDNYSDTDDSKNEGVNITLDNNAVGSTAWPASAREVIEQAGLEPAFRGR